MDSNRHYFQKAVDLFIDAALRFLDRIAEELELPMKKIEVCVTDGNLINAETPACLLA